MAAIKPATQQTCDCGYPEIPCAGIQFRHGGFENCQRQHENPHYTPGRNSLQKLIEDRARLVAALRELVARCDGEEGVRADGSNIQTMAASALLSELGEA